jgi:hypothetical protein
VPKIRQIGVLLGLMLVCLWLPMMGAVDSGFTKPLPPVSYQWERQVKGDRLYLVLHVMATAHLSQLVVRIGGNLVPKGQTEWHGPLESGKRASLILWVPLDATGAVDARVEGVTASNVHFSHGSRTHVPKPPTIAPPAPRPPAPGSPAATTTPGSPAPRVREFLVK